MCKGYVAIGRDDLSVTVASGGGGTPTKSLWSPSLFVKAHDYGREIEPPQPQSPLLVIE